MLLAGVWGVESVGISCGKQPSSGAGPHLNASYFLNLNCLGLLELLLRVLAAKGDSTLGITL